MMMMMDIMIRMEMMIIMIMDMELDNHDHDDKDDHNVHPMLHAQLKTSLWLFSQLGELHSKFTSSSSSSYMRFPLQSFRSAGR